MVSFTQEIAQGARSQNHSIYPHAAEKDLIYSVPIHVLNTWKAYARISNNNTTDVISVTITQIIDSDGSEVSKPFLKYSEEQDQPCCPTCSLSWRYSRTYGSA